MKRTFSLLATVCVILSFFVFAVSPVKVISSITAYAASPLKAKASNLVRKAENNSAVEMADELYDSLDLDRLGMNKQALECAIRGEEYLESKGIVNNPDVLTVCDFSQPSQNKRMYIIDTKNYKVLVNTYVAHGKNSGLDYANRFSNQPESLASSLGFYVTKNTYDGKHGLSLKLSGLERGFNDNAESRAVVVHGADYIGDQRIGTPYMGRSFGCPAVPQALSAKVINLIKNGTCLFIYSPSASYLRSSKILNS